MIRVVYNDKGKTVTANLPYLNTNDEYRMPKINEMVLVNHLSNGTSRGVVIGKMWNEKNLPNEYGKDLYRKDLSTIPVTALYRYDDGAGEYLLKAPIVEVNAIDELLLDGPKTRIEANISIVIETEEETIKIPVIHNLGGENGKTKIDNKADIEIQSEKNQIKGTMKKLILQTKNEIAFNAGTEIQIEDADFRTTIGDMLQRLERLDQDTSARK